MIDSEAHVLAVRAADAESSWEETLARGVRVARSTDDSYLKSLGDGAFGLALRALQVTREGF
jgi:predicted neutral ceramidase superfamily lipid hydrolase